MSKRDRAGLVIIFSIAILSAVLGFLAGVASARAVTAQPKVAMELDGSEVMQHA